VHYPARVEKDTEVLAAAIGARVRRERQGRGWTLDRLAEVAEVSRRMVVNVEQGSVNPSIGTLLRLADALGVGLPALVETARPAPVTVTRHGEGAVLWAGERGGRGVLLAATGPPDLVELWEWTLGAGERHRSDAHAPGTKELLQVLEGRLLLEAGAERIALSTGDAVRFPGDVPHAYLSEEAPTRFVLAVFEPDVGIQLGPKAPRSPDRPR
jgi:transcriptional regulator with XRE-family HTH domain